MPNWLRRLLHKPKPVPPPPWWHGYVFWPTPGPQEISIVMSTGHIIVLNDEDNSITGYINHDWYLNKPQFRIELHNPPEW